MTQIGGLIGDRCPRTDVVVSADDDGSRFSAVFFVRSATRHHEQWQ